MGAKGIQKCQRADRNCKNQKTDKTMSNKMKRRTNIYRTHNTTLKTKAEVIYQIFRKMRAK